MTDEDRDTELRIALELAVRRGYSNQAIDKLLQRDTLNDRQWQALHYLQLFERAQRMTLRQLLG